jgi:Zinc knuckle
VYHPSITETADAYLEGDISNAQEFRPGRSISIAAIPREGKFEYCYQCGLGPTCSEHRHGHDWGLDMDDSDSSAGPPPPSNKSSFFGPSPSKPNQRQAHNSFNEALQRGPSFNTNNNHGGRKKKKNRSRKAPWGSGTCNICGRKGHYSRDCPNHY